MKTYINDLTSIIFERNPSQEKFLKKTLGLLNAQEEKTLAQYIEYALESGNSLEDLAQAYLTIVEDTAREQMFFRRHRRYRHSSFDQVANSVYFDAAYMKKYMHGLALTLFLWPNHLMMKRFFDEHFPADNTGDYVEIGPGHGIFFMTAIRSGKHRSHLGIDISPTSVQISREILASPIFGNFTNYDIVEQDFLQWDTGKKFDTIVMGEVLEHVEDPVSILRQIAQVATPDSFIFVTTCMDSPAVDHITHYASMDEIAGHVEESGMKVKKQLLVPYGELTLEASQENRLPVTVALILEKTVE